MNKKRVVQSCLLFVAIIMFIIATVVFFINRKSVEKYTIDFSSYTNVSEVQSFKDEIENKLNINFEDLYIKNGGEIIVDNIGNIKSLNIDFYFIKDGAAYGVQIEKNDDYYNVIREEISNVEIEKNKLSNYLNMLSFWDFSKNNEDCNIIFNNEFINGINVNENIEKYLFSGKEILVVNSKVEGLFIKVTILLPDNSVNELYSQVK